MPDHLPRVAQLQRAAHLLATEHYLQQWGDSLNVELSNGDAALHLHGCTPEQLDSARVGWPDAEAHEDGDGILRWIETTLHGIEVTLYRR